MPGYSHSPTHQIHYKRTTGVRHLLNQQNELREIREKLDIFHQFMLKLGQYLNKEVPLTKYQARPSSLKGRI